MAHKLNNQRQQRRPLSFPAVRPCEAISPSTLLASLITLSQNICNFHPSSFVSQRRNVRETLRQIAILLMFFQELHDCGSVIPRCFSDLHVILQKIHFLMQDCTREGARLWMLVKSQFVVEKLRDLVREVAMVLDIIPVRCIDVGREVKEMVELLTKQAKRGNLELEGRDERESKRLRFVMDQLERGIEPDVEAVKIVLNYLEIESWAACNKEVKFLEDELDFNEEEVGLLNGLIGFMCYSRVVIFETIDFQSLATEQCSEAKCSVEMLSCVVPEDFLCPISLEIMTDPVTISSGQTYNRASIQKWLNAGNNLICPKTREKLTSSELFPNTALKKLIQQFCYDNGVVIVNPINPNRTIVKTTAAAAAHAMQFLSWFISRRLVFGTEDQKNKAAYEIHLLAKSNVFNRECLVEMGTVPPLLDLLTTTDDRGLQENAISALMKLSKHATGQQVIVESRGLAPILNVLKRGLSQESRHLAAAVIFYLSSAKEYRKLIGENPEAIPALVEMVREEATFGKKTAVVAIFGLLLRRKNHALVLAAGAVPALVNVLASSGNANLVTDSLAVLVALVEENVEGAYTVLRAGALPLVTGILQSATSRAGKEYCASILLALCVNVGAEVTGSLAKEASVMPSLYSLLTDGTPHAGKKARALINVIVEFTEKRFSGTVGSSVSRQRWVGLT